MDKRKMGECSECGETALIQGRGLCSTCYYRLKRDGTIDEKYPRLKRRPNTPKKPGKKKKSKERASKKSAFVQALNQAGIDDEVSAIKTLMVALAPLDSDTREAVIDYVCNRLAGGK